MNTGRNNVGTFIGHCKFLQFRVFDKVKWCLHEIYILLSSLRAILAPVSSKGQNF